MFNARQEGAAPNGRIPKRGPKCAEFFGASSRLRRRSRRFWTLSSPLGRMPTNREFPSAPLGGEERTGRFYKRLR